MNSLFPQLGRYGLIATFLSSAAAFAETKLLRFPDIQGDQIVFCYGGDLWRVDTDGGTADRVTAHPGFEVFPKFSPDGEHIAFTGQYDGDEQVYTVPSTGGVPRQLTFYPARGPLPDRWGYDNQVYGWTVQGDAVLFRSMRYGWSLTDTRLFTAALDGGLPEPLPMRVSGGGDFSPDGKQVCFSPLTRDFRTWKRYSGGWAQDLVIFNLKTHEFEQITDHPRTDRDPMWIKDRIYFASDRDGTLNLYYYDTRTKRTRQVTQSSTFDVRWPSKGDTEIVFELGGQLQVLDTASGDSRPVSITVPTDGLALRPRRTSVGSAIEDFGLSPHGERIVVAARGDVFTVPAEKGPSRNLTRSSGTHDKAPSWSPDGRHIVYLSDADGEEELYLIDQKGTREPVQLTDGGTAMRIGPTWSPDGKQIAYGDKDGKLYVLDLASREVREVADNPEGQLLDYRWSPDSNYLAFTMGNPNDMGSIHIWSAGENQLHRITDGTFDDSEPTWDPNGKYLYYLSEREFAPQIATREWNFAQNRQTGVFALALRKDVAHPFPPESDEVKESKGRDSDSSQSDEDEEEDEEDHDSEDDGREDEDDESARDEAESPLDVVLHYFEQDASGKHRKRGAADSDERTSRDADEGDSAPIEFDGLAERVTRVPIEADNLYGLLAIRGHLLYLRAGAFYYGRSSDRPTELCKFSHKERKQEVLVERVGGYAVSDDGKKALVSGEGGLRLIGLGSGKAEPKRVPVEELSAWVDPRAEWRQMFHEVWRRFRDFFYVENLHGYDWDGLRERYEPLLDHVAHRTDLNYVIGEMIAELNVGHAYIAGGEVERPSRPDVALPGAIFELDKPSGRYRIARIYRGHNPEPVYRSPLTEVGVDVSPGDYVLAIDGEDLTAKQNPFELLRFKSAHPVTLTVNSKPTRKGAHDATFLPVRDESDLIYLNFVLDNMELVEKATQGRVGYLHIPDMGEQGIREFNKWFYPQVRKEGLIIDVRSNGGGNVSQMLIERLGRKLLATGYPRTDETTNTYPDVVFHGHLVCLLDEDSASDGDIFPAMFREAGLGPLIGKRSWGGVIGITNRGTLIDGGVVNVPEFGFGSKDGEWAIEGHGVDPDIEVENDPTSLIEGRDPQLERAIREIEDRIRKQPMRLPPRPRPPVRTE